MITLGINAAFHDSSAALLIDGVPIAAAEEERFTRIKHAKRPVPFSAWELPYHAIDYCLQEAGCNLNELQHVAYSFDPGAFELDASAAAGASFRVDPDMALAHPWCSPWDPLFAAYIRHAPRQLADGAPHHLRRRFLGLSHHPPPYTWHFVPHHLCHQSSAFLAAPWNSCAVMTLDGRGEQATTTYGQYRGGSYRSLGEVHMPHSLGLLYEQVTSHLGFLHSSDEYKVMALAALGMPRFKAQLRGLVRIGARGQYRVAPVDLAAMFGPPRLPGTAFAEHHLDLAASLQDVLENCVLDIARWLREASGETHLAMAGGVALNCVLNSRLRDSHIFDGVWVQPAAGDAGTALGAALWVDATQRAPAAATANGGTHPADVLLADRRWKMDSAQLGPQYGEDAIETQLRWAKQPYRRLDRPAAEVADLLVHGAIVGWFQGRMEYGPRALGARSILASPLDPAMQTRLNELKDREDFRPVAPAIPEEDLGHWFTPGDGAAERSPFMLFTYRVLPHQRARIPAVCHTDGTARVQTVGRDVQPAFHALLRAFGERTGVPILVNTSFNVRGEPIVCTPRSALESFASTPLDALVMGPFLLEKRHVG